ncbi:unnamed protein product [Lathyrus oleraceus]|nr:uncharacterized protein LOC127128615 [Pisum sativum]
MAAAAAASSPSKSQILSLLRSFIRVSRQFPDYNIREYTKRRAVDAFRQNATLSESCSVSEAFSFGKSQFEVAKRQAVVYSLYVPPLPSVMEIQNKPF